MQVTSFIWLKDSGSHFKVNFSRWVRICKPFSVRTNFLEQYQNWWRCTEKLNRFALNFSIHLLITFELEWYYHMWGINGKLCGRSRRQHVYEYGLLFPCHASATHHHPVKHEKTLNSLSPKIIEKYSIATIYSQRHHSTNFLENETREIFSNEKRENLFFKSVPSMTKILNP